MLADGLGSGVKANILSTLTSKIICTMMAERHPAGGVRRHHRKHPARCCSVRKVAYSTFTIIRILDNKTAADIIQFDNPAIIVLRDGEAVRLSQR